MAKGKQKAPLHERVFPASFDPQPTRMVGGIARMVRCFEACRDVNPGGYGTGFSKRIKGWWKKTHKVTSCSPFTGTVIGMMFDPKAPDPSSEEFAPMYDGGAEPLPNWFYHFHNTSGRRLWTEDARAWFREHGWMKLSPYSACGAVRLFNLGYDIDPRDMRRGDLVKIDWNNKGGHSTFCWDVHLDAQGAVDSFLFLSSNGGKSGGYGVSISTSPSGLFIKHENGVYTKTVDTLFMDRDEYVTKGNWKCLPNFGISAKELKKSTTFKPSTPTKITDDSIKRIRVVRFWGMAPPERPQTDPSYAVHFAKAKELAYEKSPEPYAMGKGRAVTVAVPVAMPQRVPAEQARKPDALKKVVATPVVQPATLVLPHQHLVEDALKALYDARWIEKGPGDTTVVNDAESVAAVKDFQDKWGLKVDGRAGPITRKALFAALADLRAGKSRTLPPKPDTKTSPATKPSPAQSAGPVMLGPVTPLQPRIDHFYWVENHAFAGAPVRFAVEGKDLDVWPFSLGQITLKEKTRGTEVKLVVPIPFTYGGRGEGSVELPATMTPGSVWTALLECNVSGTVTRNVCEVELHVAERAPDEPVIDTGGWPWDERAWPRSMRDIVQELRSTATPTGPLTEQWAFSTYGVKEKMNSVGPRDKKTKKLKFANGGDVVPVLDKAGKEYGKVTRYSLFAADIEGTMRLGGRVLNITQTGRPRRGKPPHRYEEFDHTLSRWHDVTDRHPWGSGSRVPLIPYRVLAINAGADSHLYYRKVYIKALDGVRLVPTGEVHNGVCVVGDCGSMDPGRQFDFFKGRQDVTFKIDGGLGMFKNSKGVSLPLSEIAFLDECVAARSRKKKK